MTKDTTQPPVPAPRIKKRMRAKAPAPPPPSAPQKSAAPKPPPPARRPKKSPPPQPVLPVSPTEDYEARNLQEKEPIEVDPQNQEWQFDDCTEYVEQSTSTQTAEENCSADCEQNESKCVLETINDFQQSSHKESAVDEFRDSEMEKIHDNWATIHETAGRFDPDFSRNDIYMFSHSGNLNDNLSFRGNSMDNNTSDPSDDEEKSETKEQKQFSLEEIGSPTSPLPPKIVEEVWKVSVEELKIENFNKELILEIPQIPTCEIILPSPAGSEHTPSLPSSSPPLAPNFEQNKYLTFLTPLQFTPNAKKTTRSIHFNPLEKKNEPLSLFLESTLQENPNTAISAVPEVNELLLDPNIKNQQPIKFEEETVNQENDEKDWNILNSDCNLNTDYKLIAPDKHGGNLLEESPKEQYSENGEYDHSEDVEDIWGTSAEVKNDTDDSADDFADCENNNFMIDLHESCALSPLTITIDEAAVVDFFGSIRDDKPFEVAAISPRETGADSIHQNFSDFTNDMLANDYKLIETHANSGKRRITKGDDGLVMEKINEEPISEEGVSWVQSGNNGSTLSAIDEETPSFSVDWSILAEEPQKLPEEETQDLGTSDQPLEKNEVPEGTFEKSIRVGTDIVNLRLIPHAGENLEMGSNVSREKGLNRRSVSSGHLDAPIPRASKGQGSHITNHITSQATTKLCGSLPNYLDSDDDPRNNNLSMNQLNMELDLQNLFPTRNGKQEPLLLPPPPLFHDNETDKSPEEDILLSLLPKYPFITKENIFEVLLSKGSRGLGLSVTGGIDCPNEPWPGIIRIKRLFPHQPAWQDGKLAPGDVLLEADGTRLTGLTNYEALEVLRTTLTEVRLKVCRAPAGAGLLSIEPEENDSNIPLAPQRHGANKICKADRLSDDSDDDEPDNNSKPCSSGEFEFEMDKVDKSLGFTLRKEDDSRLGHYVLALVKEPAVSDGRIRPGDKIVAVNGVDISPLSHKEAVAYLRMCGEVVRLRLYRDPAQTPVSILSPDGFRTFPRTKPLLRKEAIDMLSDLAGKKQSSPHDTEKRRRASEEPPMKSSSNTNTSPRRRKAKTPPSPAENTENKKPTKLLALDLEKHDSGLNHDGNANEGESSSRNSSRPVSLDLSTPSSIRKQKFQFMSPPFSGDDDDDDASVIAGLSPPNEYPGPSSLVSQPASMPPMNLEPQFIHRKPEYQSANLTAFQASPASSDQDIPQKMHQGNQGLLKWKGVMFTPDKNSPHSKTAAPVPTAKKTPILNLEDREGNVIVVELTRGWNSRLGFTLCADKEGRTLIKDIYPDSVAFKDGRLKSGDHLVMVNDDNIEHLPTEDVIDLVRKIRGTVAITIIRAMQSP